MTYGLVPEKPAGWPAAPGGLELLRPAAAAAAAENEKKIEFHFLLEMASNNNSWDLSFSSLGSSRKSWRWKAKFDLTSSSRKVGLYQERNEIISASVIILSHAPFRLAKRGRCYRITIAQDYFPVISYLQIWFVCLECWQLSAFMSTFVHFDENWETWDFLQNEIRKTKKRNWTIFKILLAF